MASKHILKVPIESSNETSSKSRSKKHAATPQYILLYISSPSRNSLDLSLQATEGQTPFVGSLQPSRLSKLLSKDAGLTISQWESVLQRILLQQSTPTAATPSKSASPTKDPLSTSFSSIISEDTASSLDLITLHGTLSSDKACLTLHFHRTIESIHQSIGTLVLKADFEAELDIFSWAAVAVDYGSKSESQVKRLSSRLAEVESALGKVKLEMSEFLQVKEKDEEALMGKFVQVLDRKKQRIRDLESELGRSGRPWPEVEDVQVKQEDDTTSVAGIRSSARGRGRGRDRGQGGRGTVAKIGASRTNKRKATEATQADSEAAFQTLREEEELDREPAEAEEDEQTDGEELQELVEEDPTRDDDMSVDSDDLDAAPASQRALSRAMREKSDAVDSQTELRAPVVKNKSGASQGQAVDKHSGKQHAIRTRNREDVVDEDEQSTDDEL